MNDLKMVLVLDNSFIKFPTSLKRRRFLIKIGFAICLSLRLFSVGLCHTSAFLEF